AERYRQFDLVEAAMGQENISAGRQEGSGYRAHDAGHMPPLRRARLHSALVESVMDRRAMPAKEHARVLQCIIGIQQTSAHGADLRTAEQTAKALVPAV